MDAEPSRGRAGHRRARRDAGVDVALAESRRRPAADGGRARVTERAPGAGRPLPTARGRQWPLLLEISDLVKEFPVTAGGVLKRRVSSVKAVSDVSFGVGRARRSGLVGESGCGKTTLGRMIVGLEQPDRGSVTLRGQNISRLRGRRTAPGPPRPADDVPGPVPSLDPRMRVRRHPRASRSRSRASAAQGSSRTASSNCSTRSACRATRSSGIRTSSPAASASGSGWPGR